MAGLGRLPMGLCLLCAGFARAQQPAPNVSEAGSQIAQNQPPATQPPAAQPPAAQPPKTNNPFETIPQSAEPAPPARPAAPPTTPPAPRVETVKPAEEAPQSLSFEDVVESIEFRGVRRVPADTLRAMIFTKRGDKYDTDSLHRDFMALWNTGRFDDIRLEREQGRTGWIIRFVMVERRVIRSIKYDGNKSVTTSEILDRFKERKVGLSVESQYDPNKVQHARNVLQEYLAERGRQFATVEPELHQVPPSSLEVVFKVNEGPKVKVGTISFEGNKVFSDLVVRRAMKNLHPIGLPRSIFFEDLFSKSYDSTKLEEDQERVELFYRDEGYFLARTIDHKVDIVDVGGGKFKLPLIKPNHPGKDANIHIALDEGRLYHLNTINFVGVKLFRTPETLMRPVFQMQPGDVFSTAKLRKGFEDLRKLYGQFGYIDFVAEPNIEPEPGTDKVDLTLNFDEGKQFFVRRIDFSGNTTTRDKVIRRQLLIDEGDVFNTRLWQLSILRLNQLGYFEALKEEDAADVKRDTKSDTVDLTLKVKERGKNTVQLNGGVSGIAGSFLGFGYSTNNLMGLGETLSLNTTLGTVERDVTLGFTEPYLFDMPLQAGFTVFMQRFDYNQARQASILAGTDLTALYNQLGQNNLLNYVSNSKGFTVFTSYPLKRSFARVGLSYGYTIQGINTLTPAATSYYTYLDFLHINGPNSLQGITSSTITPSFTYNTVNHPITPTAGKAFSISLQFSGSALGGTVNQIEPVIDAKYFRKSPINAKHVLGFHFSGRYVTGYGGKTAPPFNRFFMGGEDDIRGFDIWAISPIAFVPIEGTVNLLNNDGSPRQQRILDANGNPQLVSATTTVPSYQLVTPGGDTALVGNFEYRIPIFGPVTLAYFIDVGLDALLNTSQLNLNPSRITQLNGEFPEANFSNKAIIAPGTQKPRASTGLELQVLMPVVNAPFRVYWAYNPLYIGNTNIQAPILTDRSFFPNQASFVNALAQVGTVYPYYERHSLFRFSVGRTF
ncbi:MAG TPA: outer membrane protein assembly factor BamA [Bryobacteraceae bacterium]|nr:outer membrane protein assembly factor BamA [Bryobacteraceae bacterium]